MYRFLTTGCFLLCTQLLVGEEDKLKGLSIASELAQEQIAIDGAFSDWVKVESTEVSAGVGSYTLKAAWSDRALYFYVEVDTGHKSGEGSAQSVSKDYFNLGLDFGNEDRLQYDQNDFHFVVSVPEEDTGNVFVSLVRTGAEGADLSRSVQASGKRSGNEYAIELAIDWTLLPSGKPVDGAIGFYLERKVKGGPFALPILWGDLVLADSSSQYPQQLIEQIRIAKSRAESVYLSATTDPKVLEEITESTKAEVTALRNRITESIEIDAGKFDAKRLVRDLDREGKWVDLSYQITKAGGAGDYIEHLDRLVFLSHCYSTGRFEDVDRSALAEAVRAASDYWIRYDFLFENWWYNEIGVPLRLGRVAFLVEDLLGKNRVEKILKIMERSYRPMTGQNLVWINTIQIMRGALIVNPELIRRSFRNLAETIDVTLGEGIQSDFSFHQHGPQLYSHGYGASFLEFAADILYFAGDGEFSLDVDKQDLVVSLLLEGNRWMARGRFADFGALGRVVSRPGIDASYLARVSKKLLRLDSGRTAELQQLSMSSLGEGEDLLAGSRYFHRSEFLVQRSKDLYASVKMYSAQMTGTESINGEALQSYYLADGATFFVRRGEEYLGIQPVWDWRRIPGVTNADSRGSVPALDHRKVRTRGGSSRVGGVSNGSYGAATYEYERDGIHAVKSYFGFDFGLVCLGMGIRSEGTDSVQTTINQTLRNGPIRVGNPNDLNSEAGKLVSKRFGSESGATTWHDGLVYWVPDGQKIVVESKLQTGSWRDISDRGSDAPVGSEVVTLRLDHGAKPDNGTYAYAVLPEKLITGLAEVPFEIVANDSQLQAVRTKDAKVVEAIFHESAAFEIEQGVRVESDGRCLLLLVKEENGYSVTVANSERKGSVVNITLHGGSSSCTETFLLPSGRSDAGASVTAFIEFKQ